MTNSFCLPIVVWLALSAGYSAAPLLSPVQPAAQPNHEWNSSLSRTRYDNALCVPTPLGPAGTLRELYRPSDGGYVGEIDLHWDARRLLFTRSDAIHWRVFELCLYC